MRNLLILCFSGIFSVLLISTIYASLDKDVFTAAALLWTDPWGKATLLDAYFAFLTFYMWVFYRESSWPKRILWFIAIMCLGNFAISTYVILQLLKLKPDDSPGLLFKGRSHS